MIKRLTLLTMCAGLIAGCVTTVRKPAPIVDRSTGAAAPVVAAEAAASSVYHVVQKGETLFSIAQQYGQHVDALVAWNNLSDPSNISVGQSLRVKQQEGAQTALVDDAGLETRSLDAVSEGKPAGAVHLTTPQGEKVPYSAKNLETMGASARPTLSSLPNSMPGSAATARLVADTTIPARMSEGIAWAWPANGQISSTFHGASKGIDIVGRSGQKVLAAADGKVIYSGTMRGYGNLVIIKHNENLLSAYANNKTIMVKQQVAVKRGQQIAEMGKNGDAVKLHFEVRRHGKPVDPVRFLPTQR